MYVNSFKFNLLTDVMAGIQHLIDVLAKHCCLALVCLVMILKLLRDLLSKEEIQNYRYA